MYDALVSDKHVQNVIDYLRKRGLRSTRARRRILREVFAAEDHFTADQLLDRLREKGERVSRASIYRTLAILVEGGFVASHEFNRTQLLYEPMLGQDHHDHLICRSCQRIVEFENEEIERLQVQIAEAHGFVLRDHSLELYGDCADCRAAQAG